MDTPMRFRTDGWHWVDLRTKNTPPEKLREWGYSEEDIQKILALEPAQPGDTWRVRRYSTEGEGPIAGYAICCPQCKDIHAWTTALNCNSRKEGGSCQHSGNGSCWNWSGSAEENKLTASPSLYASGACGWHGWLQNGVLRG